MQQWLITVNTALSCPHADSQASHLFTRLDSRCKPGCLLQTHTRSINIHLWTNLQGKHAELQKGQEPTYRCRGHAHAPKHKNTYLFDTLLWYTRQGRWQRTTGSASQRICVLKMSLAGLEGLMCHWKSQHMSELQLFLITRLTAILPDDCLKYHSVASTQFPSLALLVDMLEELWWQHVVCFFQTIIRSN